MNSSPPPPPMSLEPGEVDERNHDKAIVASDTFLGKFRWTDDGYLIPRDTDPSSFQDQPLLLEPVSNFLSTLQPPEQVISMDLEPENEEDAMDESDDEEKNDEASEGNDEKKHDESDDEPSTPPEYAGHVRVVNMIDSMRQAIAVIDKMTLVKAKTPDKKVPRHLRHQHHKIQALEKQQHARLLQKSKSNISNESNKSQDVNFSSNSSHGSPSQEESDDSDKMLVLVRAINSIRALVPIVAAILYHKQSNDRSLVIHGVNIRKDQGENYHRRKRKNRCFLIGESAFDVASSKACQDVKKQLDLLLQNTILRGLQDPQSALDNVMLGETDWSTFLPSCLPEQTDSDIANFLVEKNTCQDVANWCDDMFIKSLERNGSSYDRAVHALRNQLDSIISRRFRGSQLKVYGSCLSDLYLGESSDVDLSLYLPEAYLAKREFVVGDISAETFEKTMKRLVYKVTDSIRWVDKGSSHNEKRYQDIQAVARARVPVIKGKDTLANNPYSSDGALNFDICFLNEIAVANSSLLREYSLVDVRVKQLMLAVKKWTQYHKINSAADNYLSSYAWMNLVVFYLQCLGMVPNLQCPVLMEQHGLTYSPERHPSHCVNDLNTMYISWARVQNGGNWSQPQELQSISVSVLLYGFFAFYDSIFPDTFYAISIKAGHMHGVLKPSHLKARLSNFCIEDPFETFDSHTPHDLAMPCSENGQARIRTLWRQAKHQLEHVLFDKKDESANLKESVEWIWPMEGNGEATHNEASMKTVKKKNTRPKRPGGKSEPIASESRQNSRKKGPGPVASKSRPRPQKKTGPGRGKGKRDVHHAEKPSAPEPNLGDSSSRSGTKNCSNRTEQRERDVKGTSSNGEQTNKHKKPPRRRRRRQKAAGKDVRENGVGEEVPTPNA